MRWHIIATIAHIVYGIDKTLNHTIFSNEIVQYIKKHNRFPSVETLRHFNRSISDPQGLVDCNGNFITCDWLGDGVCDDGSYTCGGIPVDFNCKEFNYDKGDCEPPNGCIFDPTIPPPFDLKTMVEYEISKALIIPFNGMSYTTTVGSVDYSLFSMVAQTANHGIEAWLVVDENYNSANSHIAHMQEYYGLVKTNNIKFVEYDLNSVWLIDYGPIPIIREDDTTRASIVSNFYYPARPLDNKFPNILARKFKELNLEDTVAFQTPMYTEGGNFQITSEGTCFTSTRWIDTSGVSGYPYPGVSWCDGSACETSLASLEKAQALDVQNFKTHFRD